MQTAAAPPPAGAFAALLAGNVLLSFGPWLVRLADVGPVAAGFWRLLLALPLLLLLCRVLRQPVLPMPRALWWVLGVGGVLFALDLAAWHSGILRTRLANAALFGNSTSFLYPLYGFAVARRMPGRNQALALALAMVGVALLMGRSYELSPRNLAGDLLCILAGVFYTGYLIAIERAHGRLQPLPTLVVATVAGIIPLLLLAWAAGERIAPNVWWPLVLLAIGSQVAGQGLLVYAIGFFSPIVVGLVLLVQPIVAAAVGWGAYGERLTSGDLIGALAIAVALVLVRRPERPQAAPAGT